jgi:hypothetical protein
MFLDGDQVLFNFCVRDVHWDSFGVEDAAAWDSVCHVLDDFQGWRGVDVIGVRQWEGEGQWGLSCW